jgi:pyruvate/2-oxoglutarate dehydrogenase complex dihydrolipoamide acyltransferase (E2) component
MCYVSFTFDHRIMDGVQADHFLASVVAVLEKWG